MDGGNKGGSQEVKLENGQWEWVFEMGAMCVSKGVYMCVSLCVCVCVCVCLCLLLTWMLC